MAHNPDQHHSIQLCTSPHGGHWLSLHCDAPPDAPCRQQPVDPDDINGDGTWDDDTPTTDGHECWMTGWVDAVGLDDLPIYCLGPLPRIPVTIHWNNGPHITIQEPTPPPRTGLTLVKYTEPRIKPIRGPQK